MSEKFDSFRDLVKDTLVANSTIETVDGEKISFNEIFNGSTPALLRENNVIEPLSGAFLPTDSTVENRTTLLRRVTSNVFDEPTLGNLDLVLHRNEEFALSFDTIIVPRIEERVEESLLFSRERKALVRQVCANDDTYREFADAMSSRVMATSFLTQAYGPNLKTRQLMGELRYDLVSVFKGMAIENPTSTPTVLTSVISIIATIMGGAENRSDVAEFLKFEYHPAEKMTSSRQLFAQIRSRHLLGVINDEVLNAKKVVDGMLGKANAVVDGGATKSRGFTPDVLVTVINNCFGKIKRAMSNMMDDEAVLKEAMHWLIDLSIPSKRDAIPADKFSLKSSNEFDRLCSNFTIFSIAMREYDENRVLVFPAQDILRQMDKINSIVNDMDLYETTSLENFASGFGVYALNRTDRTAMDTVIICDYYVNKGKSSMFEISDTSFSSAIQTCERKDSFNDMVIGPDYATMQPSTYVDKLAQRMISQVMKQKASSGEWKGNIGWVDFDPTDLLALTCLYADKVVVHAQRNDDGDEEIKFCFFTNDVHQRVTPLDDSFSQFGWTQNVLKAFIISYPPEMDLSVFKPGKFGNAYSYYENFGLLTKNKFFTGLLPHNTFSKPEHFDISYYDSVFDVTSTINPLKTSTLDERGLRDFRFIHSTAAYDQLRSWYHELALVNAYHASGIKKEDGEALYNAWGYTMIDVITKAYSSSTVLASYVNAMRTKLNSDAKANRRNARKQDANAYTGVLDTGLTADPVRMGGIVITCFAAHLSFMSGVDTLMLRNILLNNEEIIMQVGLFVSSALKNR